MMWVNVSKSLLQKFKSSNINLKFLYCTKEPKMKLVGHLSEQFNKNSIYPSGQMFLHKIFGYRGIILHPWIASVFEKRNTKKHKKKIHPQLKVQTYYQVLMDMRDIPENQNQNAFVFTTLNKYDSNDLLDTIPGIDYVSHNNIMPYNSAEKTPIQHLLFEYFFNFDEETKTFQVSDLFKQWQEENCGFLEVDKVYIDIVGKLKIKIIPFYLGHIIESNQTEHWWRYTVCVENLGKHKITIYERHWKIISNGSVKSSRNIGDIPVLSQENPVYLNNSHISLPCTNGTVRGVLKLKLSNGKKLDVQTPTFFLESRNNSVSS